MNGDRCQQKNCTGTIQDGYCDMCGHAAPKHAKAPSVSATVNRKAPVPFLPGALAGVSSAKRTSAATTATGSAPFSRSAKGSRRASRSTSRSTRKGLGAGLITLPDLPASDPEQSVLADPRVPENKRYCSNCNAALKREAGFCGKCGRRYSLVPTLKAGDVVAGQYETRGAIAYGGLGWIYLGFDRLLSRYVVLKGLLNALDVSSAAVAVAERQFLAAVKHPNIVGIYNFVPHASEGFIVMEFVGGKSLKQIRKERGPLPPAEAIAYIHRILPAFAHLHNMGLVYCDFKPDNMMLEGDDVKLIDLGGVRRIDDEQGDIYGTVGYSAPEAGSGPTPASDLFTVGRTLAVLLMDIPGFAKENAYTLPGADQQPLFAQEESLHRWLLRATAPKPDDRFESADEMADQLFGVLREIVARETGTPHHTQSALFGGDLVSLDGGSDLREVKADVRYLPMPATDKKDPGLPALGYAAVENLDLRIKALRSILGQYSSSRELRFRLADALASISAFEPAATILRTLGEEDPWDWRVQWYAGRMHLIKGDPKAAMAEFDRVYFDVPGELAPKLALGMAFELAGNLEVAARMYEVVVKTDPEYLSALFGLARCQSALGKRKEAFQTLCLVPQDSAAHVRARVKAVRSLLTTEGAVPPEADLKLAGDTIIQLPLNGSDRFALQCELFESALAVSRSRKPNPALQIAGCPLEERSLRFELEKSCRAMAQFASGDEKVRWIDQANAARPRTWI